MSHSRTHRTRTVSPLAPRASKLPASPPSTWPIREEILTFHDVPLESGERVPTLSVRYRLEGALTAARDNL
ncbi:MAG: hypothetical protein ABMA00_16315, partial [Gemmatimonas sp.]